MTFFQQPSISVLRPLGKIVGFVKKDLLLNKITNIEEEKNEKVSEFEPSC